VARVSSGLRGELRPQPWRCRARDAGVLGMRARSRHGRARDAGELGGAGRARAPAMARGRGVSSVYGRRWRIHLQHPPGRGGPGGGGGVRRGWAGRSCEVLAVGRGGSVRAPWRCASSVWGTGEQRKKVGKINKEDDRWAPLMATIIGVKMSSISFHPSRPFQKKLGLT